RFRALGHGLRNGTVACRHFRSRLRDKPPSRHREHHRSRSHSHLRAPHHGRPDRVEAKNPRATLAGRLRRAQTFLRTLGIEITYSREGRTGTRIIKVSTSAENTVSTVRAPRRRVPGGRAAILGGGG